MKTQKGITLIALIITIIVMLILVGVSVSVALNTGLFKSAQTAAKDTEAEKLKETAISNGAVTVKVGEEEKPFNSINEYIESLKGEENEGGIKLAETPTHKLYFDNQVFLIDADTTWDEVVLTFDESRYVDTMRWDESLGRFRTWKELLEDETVPYTLSLYNGYYINARPAGSDDIYGEHPWNAFADRGYDTVPKIVDSAPEDSLLWWCGSTDLSVDESYANAEFIVKLEEI